MTITKLNMYILWALIMSKRLQDSMLYSYNLIMRVPWPVCNSNMILFVELVKDQTFYHAF